jgi:predicted ATP-grasp superfamily ATP-dependent carboligase
MRVFVYELLTAHAAGAEAPELLAQGRAMRDAIVADLLAAGDVEVTCADAGESRTAASARLEYVAPARDEAPFDFVRRLAGVHDLAWVVAPETDGVLAALARAVPRPSWIGCDARAIELAASKTATFERLAAAGIATPPCLAPGAAAQARRFVVKPDDGAGACDTRVHDSMAAAVADFERRRARGQRAVLQPWIDGEALSLSLLVHAGGAELLSINRQRIEIDAAGEVAYRGVQIDAIGRSTPLARTLEALAQRVVRAVPGLAGFVGLDVVAAAREPVLIEINPRVTCAYAGLSRALGRNLARDVLAAHLREHG